jgi:hypothetical protein
MQEDLNFREQMFLKNRGASNNGISNPLPTSDFYISEGDRLFGDNFATGEYYRRKQENEKKKERYKIRQQEQMERERRRWERIDYEYLRKENQNMVNKEKNLVGRKNNPGMAFNPLNLQYDNSVQGEILKRRDEESKYRAWMRSLNIDKHSNAGYNIINGEERTILEERLNKDIVPDLIQKNMQQINEMKNKVFNNNRNFFTSVNRNNSPQTGQYRYDNNNNFNYMNRMNKSTTPNIMPNDGFNRNGGRYREPVEYRNDFNNGNNLDMNNNMNNFNREESKNMIYPRNNSSNNMMNNNYGNYNDNNYMSPPPQKQRLNQEMQYENNNMERNNNNMNDRFNNFNGNNVTPNTLNNNMNNNINDNYGNNNQIRNMSPVNNNELNQNLPYNNYGVNPYNPYSRQNF